MLALRATRTRPTIGAVSHHAHGVIVPSAFGREYPQPPQLPPIVSAGRQPDRDFASVRAVNKSPSAY